MGYEIDFLATSSNTKSGDAIAIRFGNLYGSREDQTVILIDGGFTEDGANVVQHIKTHFGTDSIDLVISTHPDQDHINGLETILNELKVEKLWMHLPWEHNQGLAVKFHDGRITDNSIGERLKATLNKAHKLYEVAISRGISVDEPFTGKTAFGGAVKVLGPTKTYYESLIPEFDGMSQRKDAAFAESFLSRAVAAVKRVFAVWGDDQINDDGKTSAKNNSSVIAQVIVNDRRLLFTGDAGIAALDQAANQLDACTLSAKISFMQIPHHGSRRNIGPSVLNRIIGKPVAQGIERGITSIASTASDGEPKHPRKSVLNAFTHRGVSSLATRGIGICLHHDAPARTGWSPVQPEPFHYEFEEEG